MSFQFKIKQDAITPDLVKKVKAMNDPKPVLEAMGLQFTSITQRAFADSALRAASWPAKGDGSPATLRKTGRLWQSIRITQVTRSTVTVGSDAKYAAIHQFGGVITPKKSPFLIFTIGGRTIRAKKVTMPARPFFPVLNGRMTSVAAERVGRAAAAKAKKLLGEV